MAKILLPINEQLFRDDGRMAGLQIRVFEMARALARRGYDVTIGEHSDLPRIHEIAGVRLISLKDADVASFDWFVAHPVVYKEFGKNWPESRVIVDGYEYPFASFFSQASFMAQRTGKQALHSYTEIVDTCLESLTRSRAVIAANPPQKFGYLSLMCAMGLINPIDASPDVVIQLHAGAPPDPLPLEESLPIEWKLRDKGPVVLWLAGSYPWFDEKVFLNSMPKILDAVPNAQFLFVGLDGRDGGDTPRQHAGAISLYALIKSNHRLADRCVFRPWTTYADRGMAYAAADIAVATHKHGVETLYSTRTRVIDFIWARLPSVISTGDWLSDVLIQNGAAEGVRPGDESELTQAIISLLTTSEKRRTLAANLDRLARGQLSWDHQVGELHGFISQPPGLRKTGVLDGRVLAPLGISERLGRFLRYRLTQLAQLPGRVIKKFGE